MIEVLVSMLILGILAQTAWSNLVNTKASFDRNTARQSFEFDLRRARSEALSKGVRVIITVASDGKSYTVGDDLLPYDTTNGNYDTQIFTTRLPTGVTLSFSGSGSDASKLIFTSRGFLSDIGGNRTTSQRTVTLTQNGKVFTTATMYPVGVATFSS